jgi:hypothetical protein
LGLFEELDIRREANAVTIAESPYAKNRKTAPLVVAFSYLQG